jgi:hypothetical protein
MSGIGWLALIMILAFCQNIAFSMVSRSRNHDHAGYHVICAIASNAVWYATSKYLVVSNGMPWDMFLPYTIGTVSGSLTGSKISARIEKVLGITKS